MWWWRVHDKWLLHWLADHDPVLPREVLMPIYLPPNFNAACDVYVPPALPSTGPPTFTGVMYQIYQYSRTPLLLFHPGSGRWLPSIIIREPFAAALHLGVDWIVEHTQPPGVPRGIYRVQYAQRMHVGFPNQYFAYISLPCNTNGTIPKTPLPT